MFSQYLASSYLNTLTDDRPIMYASKLFQLLMTLCTKKLFNDNDNAMYSFLE